MNEKLGTTKLLWLPGDKGTPELLQTDAVALSFGARSSSVALVDGTDAGKLLIFQVTYTEANHAALCLDFLASGENNREKVQRLLVDRLVPEFEARLPELIDRTRIINYAEQLPKAAGLLVKLADCHDDILYPPTSGCQTATSDNCLLIDSTEAGSHITQVTGGQRRATKALPEATHTALAGARKALASSDCLLSLKADAAAAAAPKEGESEDSHLAHLLHNLPAAEMTDDLRSALTKCIQPALEAYDDVIKEAVDAGCTIYICDCIFSSELCRQAFLDAGDSVARGKTVRFVKDAGLLAFLGALAKD